MPWSCVAQIAERLYTSGYLSYPRTESSAYPKGFDFREVLVGQCRNAVWGEYASALLSQGFAAPKVSLYDGNITVYTYMHVCFLFV